MGKGKIIALIIAGVMLLAGLLITGAGILYLYNRPDRAAGTVNIGEAVYEIGMAKTGNGKKVTVEIEDTFSSVLVEETSVDVRILRSDDGKCTVSYPDREGLEYEIGVSENTLQVVRKGRTLTLFSFGPEGYVDVRLPDAAYDALTIRAESADVTVAQDFTFGEVGISTHSGDVECAADVTDNITITAGSGDVKAYGITKAEGAFTCSSGRIVLSDFQGGNLTVQTSSGTISLNGILTGTLKTTARSGNVKAVSVEADDVAITTSSGDIDCTDMKTGTLTTHASSGETDLTRVLVDGLLKHTSSSGDFEAEASDAGEIDITTNSGEVNLKLLTDKFYEISTNSGDVRAPQSARDGGTCRISTSSGDVRVKIAE